MSKNRERRPNGQTPEEAVEWCKERAWFQPPPVVPDWKPKNPCMFVDRNKRDGYNIIEIKGKNYPLHRLALSLALGIEYRKMPKIAGHKCGQKGCFEVEHLYLATAEENAADTVKHGRSTGPKKWDYTEMGCKKFKLENFIKAMVNHTVQTLLAVPEPELETNSLLETIHA